MSLVRLMQSMMMFALMFQVEAFAQSTFQPFQDVLLTGFNWNSSYWPFMKNGLNHRRKGCARELDCLSPAEKLDLITDHQYHFSDLLKEEKRHSRLLDRFWSGYCHSISALQLSLRDLKLKPTEYSVNGVSFTLFPEDLIAIAAYAIHVGKFEKVNEEFLGERCNSSRINIFKNKKNCREISALQFHRILTNDVAHNKPWVADLSQYAWVNNAVIQGYRLQSRALGNSQSREVTVVVRYFHISYKFPKDLFSTRLSEKEYRYRVNLNSAGEVVSAEWVDKKQPDFFWRFEWTNFTDEFSFLNSIFISPESMI